MSEMLPVNDVEKCSGAPSSGGELVGYAARESHLGKLSIRRALPIRERRMVGPWCFLDRYGPLSFAADKPMDVAPHPHIGLQTVSWLFDGEVIHHDSLGSECVIRPGALGLMTAGSGIAHSEETPARNTGRLSGVQLWLALPDLHRAATPCFDHYSERSAQEHPGGIVRLIAGEMNGVVSSARLFSPLIGAELTVHRTSSLELPLNGRFEHALLVIQGVARLDQALAAAF